MLAVAAARARRYLAGLDERPVAPGDAALAGLARFDEPLPELPGDSALFRKVVLEAFVPDLAAPDRPFQPGLRVKGWPPTVACSR